jgi:hypothetical protein
LDDQGIKQLGVYDQKLMDEISIVAQIVLDSAAEMMNIFEELPRSDYCNHPNMVESMKALIEMGKYMTPVPNPQGKITLEIRTIFEWADKLNEGRTSAIIAYLFWVSDVISENKSERKAPRPI